MCDKSCMQEFLDPFQMRIAWENGDVERVDFAQWNAKVSRDVVIVEVTNKEFKEIEAFKIINLQASRSRWDMATTSRSFFGGDGPREVFN